MTRHLLFKFRWTFVVIALSIVPWRFMALPHQESPMGIGYASSASLSAAAEHPVPPSWSERLGQRLSPLGITLEALKLYATWGIGAPALVIAVILILLLRPLQRRQPQPLAPSLARPSAERPLTHTKIPQSAFLTDRMEGLSDKQRILRFFFQLFKNQIGAPPNSPSELFQVAARATCPHETYEMRVLQEGEWTARRMSIGLLGPAGGSRSRCFYVIYDSHMVVKLPAAPITSFTAYNRQIRAENEIVARLAPCACIVPRVSIILKNVYALPESENQAAASQEEKYKHALEVNPLLQEHLKIGPSFAFFMDLAKHFFLSTILDELHRTDVNMIQEALQHPELLWDHHGFVSRYGEEAAGVCQALQEVFCRAGKDIQALTAAAKIAQDVPLFKLKRWFLLHLAGQRIEAPQDEVPAALSARINDCLRAVIQQARPHVLRYRETLRCYLQEMQFSRHRAMLESLAAKTLDLLTWIAAKGLALRDLKPENLFVAGPPAEFPYFLNDPQKFSIGLIDVETAVPIHAENPDLIPQPQLAGTPLYATPAHLLSNTVLAEIYKDVRSALHLQDWYAAIAIIFKIVTGKHLFVRTARVFPRIINRLKEFDPAGADFGANVAAINHLFWNSATAEFQEALRTYDAVLSRVEVLIPRDLVPAFIKTLDHDNCRILQALRRLVMQQAFFTSEEKQTYLLEASAEKIRLMKSRLAQESTEKGEQPGQRHAVQPFFERLERLKQLQERKLAASAALKASAAPIAADQLLEAMFQHVLSFMYLPGWPPLQNALLRELSAGAEDTASCRPTR